MDAAVINTSDDSRLSRTREISIYEANTGNDIYLWRIRKPSVGYFMGCAIGVLPVASGDHELHRLLVSVWNRSTMLGRGLTNFDLNPDNLTDKYLPRPGGTYFQWYTTYVLSHASPQMLSPGIS